MYCKAIDDATLSDWCKMQYHRRTGGLHQSEGIARHVAPKFQRILRFGFLKKFRNYTRSEDSAAAAAAEANEMYALLLLLLLLLKNLWIGRELL